MDTIDVLISDLVPDDKNARRGSVSDLIKSLQQFGQHRPVVVQRGTNKIVIGNHMVEAAQAIGWREITVTYVDDDDETALRRSLADNLVADRSGWNDDQLESLLRELDVEDAKELPGLTNQLDRLLKDVAEESALPEKPLLPLEPRAGEGYSYCVIVAQNELDNNWLRNVLGVGRTRSYKSTAVGQSHVLTLEQFKRALNEMIERGEPYA